MPVTIGDLYAPISEFFLTTFRTPPGGPVEFRFDKFGSLLGDADFIDESHPERGMQPALAVEKFSDLVNRVPVDADDNINIVLSQAAIDDIYYYRMLAPSVPAIPDNTDAGTRAGLTGTFNAIKADALRDWSRLTLQSSSGLMLNFKPCTAQPESWYDPAKSDVWTHQTFDITESAQAPSPDPSPPLLRMRPADQVLRDKLRLNQPNLRYNLNRPVDAVTAHDRVEGIGRARVAAINSPRLARLGRRGRDDDQDPGDHWVRPGGNVGGSVVSQLHITRLTERTIVNQQIQEVAPQAAVTTSNVSIDFDYCLVEVGRPWWMDVFINAGTWFVPGVPRGGLTEGGLPATLQWLPVGFIAIRNLTISAQWSAEDRANLGTATDFGPFQVEASGQQTLSHPGLQVIGWLLQRLPALPPVDPVTAPPAARTYSVIAGDTLGKIAQHFYGDANRYPDIQHANGISDPDVIYIGQVLTIP